MIQVLVPENCAKLSSKANASTTHMADCVISLSDHEVVLSQPYAHPHICMRTAICQRQSLEDLWGLMGDGTVGQLQRL